MSVSASQRSSAKDITLVTVPRKSHRDVFVTAQAVHGNVRPMFEDLAAAVVHSGLRIVSQEVFGVSNANGAGMAMARGAFGKLDWPVTWIEEGCDAARPLIGCQMWCVSDLPVAPVVLDGNVVGTTLKDEYATYCRLGGLVGDPSTSKVDQAQLVFETMCRALAGVGMGFHDVVRTWFYNERMLTWYGDFNHVRTTFFNENGVFDALVPASTAVGGRNGFDSVLTSGLLAIRPAMADIAVRPVPSPLQCPAIEYGSAFSRAVEITMPDQKRLMISGTASIAPGGESTYIGDVDAQIDLTMDVVHAILASCDMDWPDVSRAIAYFKYGKDAGAFARVCGAKNIPPLPALIANDEICRDDLLFEIELDALQSG